MQREHHIMTLQDHIGPLQDILRSHVFKAKWRLRYWHQEKVLAFHRWTNEMHFYRIPGTRYTKPITLVLAPQVGVGLGVPGTLMGYVWKPVLSYVRQPNGLRHAKRVTGFFCDDTTRKEQVW